ncbi:hypothetical protein [Candidatus Odyssella thessalonicensis]|uniref:hypothetical protein n=1 Tax=Candidatus Odyssella thessalonicensis TaxID=84647 RepID=UPI000225BC4F|nr:hypothetical protein [Candidatus Odyssella thessalonicensis]
MRLPKNSKLRANAHQFRCRYLLLIVVTFLSKNEITIPSCQAEEIDTLPLSLSSSIPEKAQVLPLSKGDYQPIPTYLPNFDPERSCETYMTAINCDETDYFTYLCANKRLKVQDCLKILQYLIYYPDRETCFLPLYLHYNPKLITQALHQMVTLKHHPQFTSILNAFKSKFSTCDLFSLFITAMNYKSDQLITELLQQPWVLTPEFLDQAAIYSAYDGHIKFFSWLLKTGQLSSNCLHSIFSILDLMNRQHRACYRIAYKDFSKLKDQATSFSSPPIFNHINSQEFLGKHNDLLYYNDALYRLKIHLSMVPFVPPYPLAHDMEELCSDIKLDKLFIKSPRLTLAQNYVYDAEGDTEEEDDRAHERSHAEIFGTRHQIRLYIELTPELETTELREKLPYATIWGLNEACDHFSQLFWPDDLPPLKLESAGAPSPAEIRPE